MYTLWGLCSLLYPKHPLECPAQCRHLMSICGMFKNSHPQGFLSSELSSTQNSCVGPAQAEADWPPQPREAEPKIENTKAAGPGPQWLGSGFCTSESITRDPNNKTKPPNDAAPLSQSLWNGHVHQWTSNFSGKKQYITWAILIGKI